MDRPNGQPVRTGAKRSGSSRTRQRLLDAAAELIAEFGWGRVTTRAVAERAGLPHGAVSYHFSGKQELLTQAALRAVERMSPMGELESVETLEGLMHLVQTWVGDRDAIDPVGTGVLLETMRESGRNSALRHSLATMLRDYRRVVADLMRAEQNRDAVVSGPAPSALATLIAAAGDGLLLHTLLDPELDVAEATEALHALLSRQVLDSSSGYRGEGDSPASEPEPGSKQEHG